MEENEYQATEIEEDETGDGDVRQVTSDDDWKDTLRAAFEDALAEMDPEDGEAAAETMRESTFTDSDGDNGDLPDLYSFYQELVALRGEQRTGNRKNAQAFTQFSQALGVLEQRLKELKEAAPEQPVASGSTDVPDRFCMGLAMVYDRIGRIRESFATPPKAPLFGGARWLKAWQSMSEAVDMLHSHVEELLRETGMEKIPTANQRFDPTMMRAVAVRTGSGDAAVNTVCREIASGWLKNGNVITPAEVEIHKAPQ